MTGSGEERIVATQEELDAALAAAGAIPVCMGRGFFRVGGSARVVVRGFTEVEARDTAIVEAREHAVVHAFRRAEVEATDDAEVHAEGEVTVRARGRAIVYASEGTSLFLSEQAVATIEGPLAQYQDSRGGSRLCPICGAEVEDWVCTNTSECGYILCSICADGSGGSNTHDREPCPHFAAMVWHETDEIMMGVDATIEPPLSARIVLDDLAHAASGVSRSSVFLGSMAGSGAWTDYFVPDLAEFQQRLQARLRDLSSLSGFDGDVFAVEPGLLLGLATTSEAAWAPLVAAGVRRLVDLTGHIRGAPPALEVESLALEDLHEDTDLPIGSDEDERRILDLADAIVAHLSAGEGVVVHGDTPRTATVAGCALLRLGLSLDEVSNERLPYGWLASTWQKHVLETCAKASRGQGRTAFKQSSHSP